MVKTRKAFDSERAVSLISLLMIISASLSQIRELSPIFGEINCKALIVKYFLAW